MERKLQAAQKLHNDAVVQFRNGRYEAAYVHLVDAVRILGADRIDCRTLKALWEAGIACGAWETALAAGFAAGARDPLDFTFVDRVLRSLNNCPLHELRVAAEYPALQMPAHLPSLSVIIPSRDDSRFAAVDAAYEKAFADWAHQRIRVKGASSMYEAWSRGFDHSDGEILIFSHDDIAFAVPDFAARLADAMKDSDIVGVAGTTRVSGPALLWSGHPFLHGAIVHRADGPLPYQFGLLSLRGPRIGAAEGLDGVFIAARRDWVQRVRFDPQGFTGFHFYDLDFTFRARQLGARITIANDLALVHASRGTVDDAWTAARAAFAAKFPTLNHPRGHAGHWYTVSHADEQAIAGLYAKLFAVWAVRLP